MEEGAKLLTELPFSKQDFEFTNIGEVVFDDELCLDVPSTEPGSPIKIMGCEETQKWEYSEQV